MATQTIEGQYVDLYLDEIYPAALSFAGGVIKGVERLSYAPEHYILPGFIDAHVHIESAMVSPGRFAEAAVKQGTVGAVSDPHEIANVLGVPGVEYMLRDAKKVPFHFLFGAPSCVPATSMETSGAVLNAKEVEELLLRKDIYYLSEMMNFPGLLAGDREIQAKLRAAKTAGKPVDGHAPGLSGKGLKKYIQAGISTDHESEDLSEAKEKISRGMSIQIREGSAAQSFEKLHPLIAEFPTRLMFCSDDIHPEMLQQKHIKDMVIRGLKKGYPLFDLLRIACLNPLRHYAPAIPWAKAGGPASWIITGNLRDFPVMETWIQGRKVFDGGEPLFRYSPEKPLNQFRATEVSGEQLQISNRGGCFKVIGAEEGTLFTTSKRCGPMSGDYLKTEPERDLLLLAVKDRYKDKPPVSAMIRGFGLKRGSIASSVAHDSHNVLAVGASPDLLARAMNRVIASKGGLAVCDGKKVYHMELPLAGLMSLEPVHDVAAQYMALNEKVLEMGCSLKAPFMTLSFMSLLVIPELKLGDRGLFDVENFDFVEIFDQE